MPKDTLGFPSKSSPRLISSSLLHPLRDFHAYPIDLVFHKESYQPLL